MVSGGIKMCVSEYDLIPIQGRLVRWVKSCLPPSYSAFFGFYGLSLMGLGQVKILIDRSKILTRLFSSKETTFYHYPKVKIEKSEKTGHPNNHV